MNMTKTKAISISEIVDKYFPPRGLNTEREKNRIDMNRELLEVVNAIETLVPSTQNKALVEIFNRDGDMFQVINTLLEYLVSTYQDKYADAAIQTSGMLYSRTMGKGFNVGNSLKYLSRYATTGFTKSENTEDLLKSIHYQLFELIRRNLIDNNTIGEARQ